MYREIINLGDENTANARWEPAGSPRHAAAVIGGRSMTIRM
jgi:hypothetical protein